MSAESVTEALAGWEDRLRSLGSVAVDCLQPGISREQIDALAAEFDGGLPEEAAAIWMWHDGCDHGRPPMPGLRGLVPHRFFLPLRQAFAQALELYEMTSAPEQYIEHLEDRQRRATDRRTDPDTADLPGHASWYRPWWLVLLAGGGTTFVDCGDPDSPEAPIGVWDPHDDLYVGTLTLPERVWWWHWALDTGHWWVDDDGLWGYDHTTSPEAVLGDIAFRHVLP